MNNVHSSNNLVNIHGANDLPDAQTAINKQQIQIINDLADGRLHGEGFANAMSLLNNSSHARAVWHKLHVVGDVLRSNDLANCQNDSAFIKRMKLALQQEPVIQPIPVPTLQTTRAKPSANDSVFVWKSVAGLASLVGVMAVSWSLLNGEVNGGGSAGGEFTSAPTQTNQTLAAVVAADTAVSGTPTGRGEMLRDAQLDAMIAAHKQLGGYSALQAPSGFLRHATFDKSRP